MSNFSQFLRGTVSVGEWAFFPTQNNQWMTYTNNFTIDGAEYLRAGYLKVYDTNKYSQLIVANKHYGIVLSNVESNVVWQGDGYATNTSTVLVSNGNVYFCILGVNATSGNYLKTAAVANLTSNVTATANVNPYGFGNSPDRNFRDVVVFKNNVITIGCDTGGPGNWTLRYIASSTSSQGYLSGSTIGFVVPTANDNFCISMDDTLDNGISGNVRTSTTPPTWTSRTPSVSMTVRRCAWCKAANNYVFVTNGGTIYTAPDGFTFTLRTAPTGMPFPSYLSVAPSQFVASSDTATLISLTSNTLLKMTSNTNYSLISLDTILPYAYTIRSGTFEPPKITYVPSESRFYLYPSDGDMRGGIWSSSDDGATWNEHFMYTISSNLQVPTYNGVVVANGDLIIIQGNPVIVGRSGSFNRLNNTTPDYIGHINAQDQAFGQFAPYLRIA